MFLRNIALNFEIELCGYIYMTFHCLPSNIDLDYHFIHSLFCIADYVCCTVRLEQAVIGPSFGNCGS